MHIISLLGSNERQPKADTAGLRYPGDSRTFSRKSFSGLLETFSIF